MSFSKEAVGEAYEYTSKICRHCPECQSTCHIHIAKDTLYFMTQSGSKFFEGFPDNILTIVRSLPISDKSMNKAQISAAYDGIRLICDNCPLDDHDEFCAINIVLTALGTLKYGAGFLTERDIQVQS
ncbi:hypothetical protein [Dendrosporobacter sp. 1207_IL3150]|uniref:hypothetical protein n=1 Tax=Dendrosporobacter sp. 1207_IL3150 TaxID=3084054 RepID=UPI002FD941A6